MEVEDVFEEWDGSDMIDMEEIESVSYGERIDVNKSKGEDSVNSDSENESDTDVDNDDEKLLRCKNCRKIYRTKSWFLKHQSVCDGASRKQNKNCRESSRMSQHQIRTRDVLAGLGVDEYFASNGVPAVLKMLNDICETPADTAAIRGARYANLRIQADVLRCQLKNSQHVTTGAAESFLMNVTYNLWEIIFAKDHNSSSSSRQRYVAQHLTQYRSSRPLLDCWSELMRTCGVNSNGKLLMQKIITTVYEDISEFRSTSVNNALEIIEKYQGETENESILTSVDKSVISYIAGYVCRKTRDRLQRYCVVNSKSTNSAVVDNCRRLDDMAKTITNNLTSVEKHAPFLSYPNLMTLSLNRGGLAIVDSLTFDFFCCLELSIRPFLNLANFRSSTRKSDRVT